MTPDACAIEFLIIFVLPAIILFSYFLFARDRLAPAHKWSLWLCYIISLISTFGTVSLLEATDDFSPYFCSLAYPVLLCLIVHLLATFRAPRFPVPLEIRSSLKSFRRRHGSRFKKGFLIMRFGEDKLCADILASVAPLEHRGVRILRADSATFNDNLLLNVQTFIHGCDFGIAVFEKLEENAFNPNIALEVGYTLALGKPVLLLKDKRLRALPTDLLGTLYKSYDPENIRDTVPRKIIEFLEEKGLK